MKRLEIIFLIIIILLCSCRKDVENIPNFPITLYASEITNLTNVRLFVGKTQITDDNILNKFISDISYFELPNIMELSNKSMIFLSNDSATWDGIGFSVNKNTNQFLFYSPFFMVAANHQSIVRPLLKHKEDLVQVLPEFITNYCYTTRNVNVGYGSYANMGLCILTYKISRTNSLSHFGAAGTILNEFNKDAIDTLQPSDTLAIREYRIRFITK